MPSPSLVAREEEPQGSSSADIIEACLPAFAGLSVPPHGSSNVERPDEDLAKQLQDIFCTRRSLTAAAPASWFEAIAGRIREMESMLLGGTWVAPPPDPED